ncbi:hypothetical protein BDV40DRAFT_282508 [Aspergillus tamarii]|uniref:Secreted protein n=1 Tax=Aspergillus tamarii TaxID=41984 RepID=A0A5N6UBI4_ASPTM|nr:hypothetical protein BDV40DRAFT_282508 [Aspergillus tamarii]
MIASLCVSMFQTLSFAIHGLSEPLVTVSASFRFQTPNLGSFIQILTFHPWDCIITSRLGERQGYIPYRGSDYSAVWAFNAATNDSCRPG